MTIGETLIITVLIPTIIGLVASILLALIPACIARNKGRSAGLWWLASSFSGSH